MTHKILVLDFGGQYTQLIAKAIRKCSVFSEIVDSNISAEEVLDFNPKGIVLSGGPKSVYEDGAPTIDPKILELGIPFLGICYGMQLMNHLTGGGFIDDEERMKEYGETNVKLDSDNLLFEDIGESISAVMSHGDSVDRDDLSPGFVVSAETEVHVAGIANLEKNLYGVQFHPEVTHTEEGFGIIDNFVKKICCCSGEWDMGSYIEEAKKYIQETIGTNDVICFVSGGVDSSLVASLLSQTEGIGTVFPVYIGALMRKDENEEVQASLKKAGISDLIFVDAEERFIEVLAGVNEPEKKRKIIGNFFGELQSEIIEELGLDGEKTFLAQGTLYTDLIESGKGVGSRADNIKSHHNVGCKFIEDLKSSGRVVEPNRLIFKDEVRAAARQIGLPLEIAEREPFPGPGLGIRIVDCAEESGDWEEINSKVNGIAREEGLSGCVLPVKTVGVQGDARTYSYLGMLWGERDWTSIRSAAKKIPQQVHSVNRVVYSFEEPTEISKIKTFVTRKNVELLKEVDHVGRGVLSERGVNGISQTIFVLFGSGINSENRSIALRAVSTDDFMTVSPFEVPWGILEEIKEKISKLEGVGSFVIDVTDKPPATTCWE